MITIVLAYLTIGCIFSLFILWTSTAKDFDNFVRDVLEEEPPTLKNKIVTSLTSVVMWPIHLYWIFKHD